MQIIKDKKIIEDHWIYVPDSSPVQEGDIIVSFARWQKDRAVLMSRNGGLGIRLGSEDMLEEIKDDLDNLNLIELDFSAFTDGRGFSQAWLLRNRFQYGGELRAVGNFMLDQIFYLSRVGFNSFNLDNPEDLPVALETLDDFTVTYQASTC